MEIGLLTIARHGCNLFWSEVTHQLLTQIDFKDTDLLYTFVKIPLALMGKHDSFFILMTQNNRQ